MKEEHVTKAILKWLLENKWVIVCFDFPQSGTGRFLHPNGTSEKNKDAINPDIVAVKADKCLFFENKDRYYYPDYEKQNSLITDNNYTDAIAALLDGYNISSILYGIGMPCAKYRGDAVKNQGLVDFIVGVEEDKTVKLLHNPKNIEI